MDVKDLEHFTDQWIDQKPFEKLDRALEKLPIKQRNIIQLLKLEGFTVKEIAKKTGMSESSIKVSAHRGYKNLRKYIVSDSNED